MNYLGHLYHRIMGHIKPFDTKDAKFVATWRDKSVYPFFVPGIRKFLADNGCSYRNNFPNPLCCFELNNVEIDQKGISALAEKGYHKSIMNYLCHIVAVAKT